MKILLCCITFLVVLGNSPLYAKDWVDYPKTRDMSNMTELQKANTWLTERGEVNLVIYPNSPFDLKPLVNVIQIVHVEPGKVTAIASKHAFEHFLEYGFDYEVQTPEFLSGPVPMSDYAEYLSGEIRQTSWYKYPTYQAYVGFLDKWQTDYPKICKKYDLGPAGVAAKNHRIYAMRISDNVGVSEPEPKYLETNTIHGDEVLNMMNCLHMVDTILTNYGKDSRLTKLVDSLDMWFIPNMNPDGTYPNGDGTVQNAQRANVANGWDLNRNNPCPCEQGAHKLYGNYTFYSKETEALQGLHKLYKFPFAQDQHGGTETYLWPYGGIVTRPKDEDWYKWLTKILVDQIHKDCNNSGYMTSCGGDGVGNIYSELYECHGIRADMNDWVGNGKSITLESSITKLLSESQLQDHWKWIKEALFMSYEMVYNTGLHGMVTDSQTNKPILGVAISRNGDIVNGTSLTDSCGRYVKFMMKGTYTITYAHKDYVQKQVSSIAVTDYTKRQNLDVKLWPINPTGITGNAMTNKNQFSIISDKNGVRMHNLDAGIRAIGIYGMNGRLVSIVPVSFNSIIWDGADSHGATLGNGCYVAQSLQSDNKQFSQHFILQR